MFIQYFRKFSFLLFSLFIISISYTNSEYIYEIEIQPDDANITSNMEDLNSQIFKIHGNVRHDTNFLVITSKNNPYENTIKQSPLLFITKELFFNSSNMSYDYTSVDPSPIYGNKLVIPLSYYTSGEINGFYLNVTCPIKCIEHELTIEFHNQIRLKLGEKFSYYSKDDKINSILLNIALDENYFNKTDKIILTLTGGEPTQLKMIIDDNKQPIRSFGNLIYSMINYEDIDFSKSSIMVMIQFEKNVKFTFNSEIYNTDYKNINITERNVVEGEYNQYFAINGKRKECFNVINLNEQSEDYSYDYENSINRDIMIIAEENFEVNVSCIKKGESNQRFFEKENNGDDEDDNYVVSNGLYCLSTVRQICIQSDFKEISLIQIHIQKRINKKSKMSEPLMNDVTYKFILNEETEINTDNNRYMNIHTHSQFYNDKTHIEDESGLNVGVQVLYGIIKVYKYICMDFPYCQIDNETLTTLIQNENTESQFETIYGEGGYYSTNIYSKNEDYSMSNKQSIIIVACKDNNFDGCSYEITYYNILGIKKLINGNKITKYLSPYQYSSLINKKDNYFLLLHKNQKVVLDLIVYSGDAYLYFNTLLDGCKYDEYHFGSNERRIITCNEIVFGDSEKLYISFEVRALLNAAYYSVYYLEKDNKDYLDAYPMETTIMESIKDSNRNIQILGKYFNDPPTKANSYYVSIFKTINCDLEVINMNTTVQYDTKEYDDFAQDIYKASKRNDLFYQVRKTKNSRHDDKYCLYFISSYDSNNEDSSFIIPESKPFKFKLSYDITKIRVSFPLAINDEQSPESLFAINLINRKPVKLTIQVGSSNKKEYVLFTSKNINLLKGIKLRKYAMTKILIIIELYNKFDEAIISFNIQTKNKIPYVIQTEKIINDVTINNEMKYYMALIYKNTEGEILMNFNRGSGDIYARLVNEDQLREVGGWNNRYILPTENSDNLLPYDYINQKVKITKDYTKNCNDYCYLLFGIKTENKYNYNSDEYLMPFSIYLKIDEYDNNNKEIIHFIDLPNNEYISNSLDVNKKDYYKLHIYDFKNENIKKILIDFNSEHCSLSIGFNTPNFTSYQVKNYNNTKNHLSQYVITKKDITELFDGDDSKITDDFTLYIRVSNSYKEGEVSFPYSLRINIPTILSEIKLINTLEPVYCTFTEDKNYCDAMLKLESYDYKSNIEIYGIPTPFSIIRIYANLKTSDELGETLQKGRLPNWPSDSKTNDYSLVNKKGYNYLLIKNDQVHKFDGKVPNDLYLLIRIYGEPNVYVELYTSLLGYNYQSNNLMILPPNKKELFTVNDDLRNISLQIPNDDDYSLEIIPLYGKGYINYNNKTYPLSGNFEPLNINAYKSNLNNTFILFNDNGTYYSNNDSNSFKCMISYKKTNSSSGINKLSFGSNNFEIDKVKFPISFYMPIDNINNTGFSFNLFFEKFGYKYDANSDNNINGTLTKNYTEDFVIKGYLITKGQLISLLINQDNINNDLVDKAYHYNGNYDISHRYGNIYITRNQTKNFKSHFLGNNTYIYVMIDKAPLNRNNYQYINGKANIIVNDESKISIPADTYIFGYFPGNNTNINQTLNHTFKLNLLSFDNINSYIKAEFSSSNNLTKFKTTGILDNNTKVNLNDILMNKYSKMNEFGKEIYIISLENLKEISYVIETNETKNPTEYTFKYSVVHEKDHLYDNISYNPNILNFTFNPNKYDLSISFDPLKNKNNNKTLDCDYYISIIEKSKIKDNNNNTMTIRRTRPFTTLYKINSNDIKNDTINVNLHTYTNNSFYVNILAEDKNKNELFSYNKKDSDTKKEEEEEEKKGKKIDWMMIVIIVLCVLIFIILIIICCCCCCCKKGKKRRNTKTTNVEIPQDDSLLEKNSADDVQKAIN